MTDWKFEAKQKSNDLKNEIKERLKAEEEKFYSTIEKPRQEIEKLMEEARKQGFLVTIAEEKYRYLSIHEDWQNWEYHDDKQLRSHRVITWTITDRNTGNTLVIDLGVQNKFKTARDLLKIFPNLGPNPYKYDDVEASTDGKMVKEKILEWLADK